MSAAPPPLDPWIEGYLAYLLEVGRKTKRTVIDVRCTLRRASEAFAASHPGQALWELELVDYLGWLEAERRAGRTEACLAKYARHLRGLLDYSWRSGRSDRNVLDGLSLRDRSHRRPPRVLSLEEAERLVAACDQSTARARRDRVIVLLLYGCGLRTAELCALRVQDVDRERREIFVANGKGDRQRVVPIPDGVYTALLAYLLERGGKRGALFRTEAKRRPLSSKDVTDIVREAVERAGLEGPITPRTLRHTFATHGHPDPPPVRAPKSLSRGRIEPRSVRAFGRRSYGSKRRGRRREWYTASTSIASSRTT